MDVWDLLILAGLAAAGYGLWLLHPPLAIIFVGLAFVTLGFLGSRRSYVKRQSIKREP